MKKGKRIKVWDAKLILLAKELSKDLKETRELYTLASQEIEK